MFSPTAVDTKSFRRLLCALYTTAPIIQQVHQSPGGFSYLWRFDKTFSFFFHVHVVAQLNNALIEYAWYLFKGVENCIHSVSPYVIILSPERTLGHNQDSRLPWQMHDSPIWLWSRQYQTNVQTFSIQLISRGRSGCYLFFSVPFSCVTQVVQVHGETNAKSEHPSFVVSAGGSEVMEFLTLPECFRDEKSHYGGWNTKSFQQFRSFSAQPPPHFSSSASTTLFLLVEFPNMPKSFFTKQFTTKISAVNSVFQPDHFPHHPMGSYYFLPNYIDWIFVDIKAVFLFPAWGPWYPFSALVFWDQQITKLISRNDWNYHSGRNPMVF